MRRAVCALLFSVAVLGCARTPSYEELKAAEWRGWRTGVLDSMRAKDDPELQRTIGELYAFTSHEYQAIDKRAWSLVPAPSPKAPSPAAAADGRFPTDWRIIYDPRGGKNETGSFLRCEEFGDDVPVGSYRRIEDWGDRRPLTPR